MKFDNSYHRDLEGFYAPWDAAIAPAPKLIKFNHDLAQKLGLNTEGMDLAAVFSGAEKPNGAQTLAQTYAGHQFGGFSPQLGDGRALLLGEVVAPSGNRIDIQLKGSGRTPFSRNGDGKAALGPVLREYILAEAMHALNIPTTRALAAVTTGEHVQRETGLTGAVLTRTAASHIRVGTFQFFAARQETDKLKQLADYSIQRHYPELADKPEPYLSFLNAVCDRQISLIAKWMAVGFIHGVMNTDNVTISGETIDYGPCAFMDNYDLKTVYSSIDTQGRYAFGNQPPIARWNIARLAEALLPLINSDQDLAVESATKVIDGFADKYEAAWLGEMRPKFGFTEHLPDDADIADTFLQLLAGNAADHTLGFRALLEISNNNDAPLLDMLNNSPTAQDWIKSYRKRLAREELATAQELMAASNPIYIPRNHLVEQALHDAEVNGVFETFENLLLRVTSPFKRLENSAEYENPAPFSDPNYKTFCGT